jgi:hypothetical protein
MTLLSDALVCLKNNEKFPPWFLDLAKSAASDRRQE